MKYYMILLWCGVVIDICSYDDEESRDKHAELYKERQHGCSEYDEVQTLNIVN